MYYSFNRSEALIDKFSRDLSAEVRAQGITVQTVLPGLVNTNMTSSFAKTSIFLPNAETYVRSALSTLGNSN